ncbi:exopolyphosphatase [Ferrovibrio sp.]|uniref:exopolyphosphatase n=1 Tax=Ferrovibrio sp. TaxID=1917215 RepID=UPI001B6DC54A|nr:exopolyphosphatase [Ferrovibrio sp.]MBP7064380.1 exopolyphosphatase [Ferrovibrio sp.]
MSGGTYRLVTRSDFDGLASAVLLKELGLIDEIRFVHPKDMQDGLIAIGPRDIVTNLPYAPECHLCFDHHLSEAFRVGAAPANHIIRPGAASAARVVWEHFGGAERFPRHFDAMMAAVDKTDSAAFTVEEVLQPQGWALLGFLMDARTGLGRFRQFRISNYQLMLDLIDYCRSARDIADILAQPDVAERAALYFEHEPRFREQLLRCGKVQGNVVVLDLRNEETIWAGNRFMVYALYLRCSISVHVLWGVNRRNTVLAVGKTIFGRAPGLEIGPLLLHYGGGGHAGAGTCQISNEEADRVLREIVTSLREDL